MRDNRLMREKSERKASVTGLLLTVALHVCAFGLVSFSSLKYIYPPPEEKPVLIDFSEDIELTQELQGKEPQAEELDLTKPVELTQKSESVQVSQKENLTPETKQDDFGDVETPAPEIIKEEPKLDPRAAFPGMAKKDTTLTAPHSASTASESFLAGQVDGNTGKGRIDGKPNAHVKGRNTVGNIPRPAYNVQESGVVVVDIWVDNYGNVVKAVPGGDGTTTLNSALNTAARNAAMETHFNMNADAPAMQQGTITYYFNLR